jgi:hypothetical protein
VRDDPVSLWWHLAGNVPPRRAQLREVEATVLLLTAVAALLPDDPLQFAADWLAKFGYGTSDGTPITKWVTRNCVETAWTVLVRTGSVERGSLGQPDQATQQGAIFARAALRTWPGASK